MQVIHVHIHQEVCLQYCCVVSQPLHLLSRVEELGFKDFRHSIFTSVPFSWKEQILIAKEFQKPNAAAMKFCADRRSWSYAPGGVAREGCDGHKTRSSADIGKADGLKVICFTTSAVKCLGLVEPDTIAEAFMSKSNRCMSDRIRLAM
ncbi:hypothetical protein GUJ93_ZPchr0008g12120 [Zizania palustris]|uniref:Uncharacterized protein n=1 Tax=Zizania palustris TaxID=103762 RepID=A0A8J5RVH1_ZIZPA|nr:hypothetical protein GUJ93_ZPchr0008g12120 [Zizania palustris]